MISKRRKNPRAGLSSLKDTCLQTVALDPSKLFAMSTLIEGETLPLVITPSAEEVDLAVVARSQKRLLEEKLLEHGAILFRGFQLGSVQKFERFVASLCSNLYNENGEHPRENISGNVYTPVFYSPERKLLWHNENSFNYRWPLKIWFCCVRPADTGGETPIVDSCLFFERLDPAIRERFVQKGVTYVRNYGEGPGLSWQEVFRTHDKAEVEGRCRQSRVEFEWKRGDRLRTRCVRPAVVHHPKTGKLSWFNQVQHWHLSCLDVETRSTVLELFSEEDLPRTCYYGDGTPIADADMQAICELYQELEVAFPWQQGDVLMVDNVLVAHARNPFTGPRKLLVALGELESYARVN